MNLTELTNYVWAQSDTSEYDLPASLIAGYLDEAFARTIAAENRWPSYERSWSLVTEVDTSKATIGADVNPSAIMSVVDPVRGVRLEQIAQGEGESRFDLRDPSSAPNSSYYSVWGDKVTFWPLHNDAHTYTMRGYRKPLSTFDVDGQVDADVRLHRPLAHYAVALAYAREEDETLETVYMQRWQRDVELARKAIMDPSHNRPVVMYGNFPRSPVGGYRTPTGRGSRVGVYPPSP